MIQVAVCDSEAPAAPSPSDTARLTREVLIMIAICDSEAPAVPATPRVSFEGLLLSRPIRRV
jgi:hypothetical protein